LGRDRRHDRNHVLDHGACLRRRQCVHGLLRGPLSPSQGEPREVRAREQEARVVACRTDRSGRRLHVGPRPVRLGEIRRRSERRGGARGRGQAMVFQLSLSGERRQVGYRRSAARRRQ
jgi:hypothetical protein